MTQPLLKTDKDYTKEDVVVLEESMMPIGSICTLQSITCLQAATLGLQYDGQILILTILAAFDAMIYRDTSAVSGALCFLQRFRPNIHNFGSMVDTSQILTLLTTQ